MANLELEARITLKQPIQSGQGARGTWEKQDFVVEYQDGNFPSSACFTAWGQDKVAELARYQVGDMVKISFNIRGREYNGRWFNDLRVWRISPAGAASSPAGAPADTTPFPSPAAPGSPSLMPSAPIFDAPAPSLDDMPGEFGDDLPF